MHTASPPAVESALLVLNRTSGVGLGADAIEGLQRAFHACFRAVGQRVCAVTDDHDEVARRAREFLAVARGPCFLLAGGGGGTNRALLQGLLDAVRQEAARLEDVSMSALRLGSGNLVPKHFGLPREPYEGMARIAADLAAGRSQPCCVYRCTFHRKSGAATPIYGLTMGGLGQFGRVPDDIKRWRAQHPWLMRWLARAAPLEAINTAQYLGFSLWRALRCMARPARAELVELCHAGCSERLRLLAAVLLNFDFPQMPIRAGCAIAEPRLSLCLLPYAGRRQTAWMLLNWRRLGAHIRRFEITAERPLEIRFPKRASTILALDEDTFAAPSRLTFEVAATVRFVTGSQVPGALFPNGAGRA
jgi:hypothetical protein